MSNQSRRSDAEQDYLRQNATRALGDTDYEEVEPRWGTAHFNSRTDLVLTERDSGYEFIFDAEAIDELVMGRFDPDTQEAPPIDLDVCGGQEKGVSRRHALIVRREGALNIVDEGSHNGTYLNGQRLVPHQPRILRDGDDVRLGYLVMRVKFARTPIE